jgi:alpha-1,3-rhamnosyl/mannosyltransferase
MREKHSTINIGYGVTVLARGLNSHGIDGIGTYTQSLAHGLLATETHQLTPVSFNAEFQRFEHKASPSRSPAPLILPRFDAQALASTLLPIEFFSAKRLMKSDISLFHATDHLVPKLKNIPVVATIHDTIPLSHPAWIKSHLRQLKLNIWKKTIGWANHIITISEYSKHCIIKHLNIADDQISVIHPGVGKPHFEKVDTHILENTLKKWNLDPGFFLFIGTLQPRKNLKQLISAHAKLNTSLRRKHPLVLVGRAGWNCDEEIAALKSLETAGVARWLNYLPDDELQALKQSALALTFPSLAEGFGLPVIEAFAAELPVICSNTTSLPEVAKDAALLIDPDSCASIHSAMLHLIHEPALRRQLRERGLMRAQDFSWETCAKETLAVYAAVLKQNY